MSDFPVNYCCSYRLGSGETVEDFLKCIDFADAFEKAKDDVKNKLWCESVFFDDEDTAIKFTLDDFDKRSGKLEMTSKNKGITHSHHVGDFCALPLGFVDHHNKQVFLDCYEELKALWDTDSSIENAFMYLAESRYENISDFMTRYCKFGKEQTAIIQKYYGDYESIITNHITEHRWMWCERYFDGKFYRKDWEKSDKSKSIPIGKDNSEVPF